MKSLLLLIAAAVIVQLVGETTAAAYQLVPISRVFAPNGSQATQSFELVNSGRERVALVISFETLARDESYVEHNVEADDDFLAYPSQVILGPGARQTVRVSWLGAPSPTSELAYRIVVTQVPIETLDRAAVPDAVAAGKIRVLLNYRGTIFIRPAKAAPSVSVESAIVAIDKAHGKLLAITLANSGTAHGRVRGCSLRAVPATGGPEVLLSAAVLEPLRNTRVLARSKRRYLVAWPNDLAVGPVKVSGRCSVES
jgi:fimbrial chaperone protein